MTSKFSDIAETIRKEAVGKYSGKNLMTSLEGFNPEVFKEIVSFFKEQSELHPHLEAYEIYPLVEETLSSKKPTKEEIRQALDGLLQGG